METNDNPSPWQKLFKSAQIKKHDGETLDYAALESKAGVMLYFSAHWCPPSRTFNPQLIEYYNQHKDVLDFEIIFVSSDSDEEQFKEYWGKMPWPALEFARRDVKKHISNKYVVEGIPTLLVLDNNANLITKDGREGVGENPTGFPWTPKSFWEIMTGDVLGKDGKSISLETLQSHTAIGIYFSAHWCPPCRGFTPKLKITYEKIKSDAKNFEIILCSWDSSEEEWKEYFATMPWLSFPYKDPRVDELQQRYGISGVPSLIIVDPLSGNTITQNGRNCVSGDPDGNDFPWEPKPCYPINKIQSILTEKACFVYLDKNLNEEIINTLTSVAENAWEKWKNEDTEPLLTFAYGQNEPIVDQLKTFLGIVGTQDPVLFILDEEVKYISTLNGQAKEEDFVKFYEEFIQGKLIASPLRANEEEEEVAEDEKKITTCVSEGKCLDK